MTRPLRLAVNLRPLTPRRIGGMETYARRVLAELLRHGPAELESMTIFTSPRNHAELGFDDARVRKVLVPEDDVHGPMRADMRSHGADALFCPLVALEPPDAPLPSFVTIPDVQHEIHPQFFDEATLAVLRELYPMSVQRATRVFTISDFSREGLLKAYGVDAAKVVVVPLDADDAFRRAYRADEVEEVRRRYRLPRRYVIYPAITWAHKNHVALLRAVKAFNARREPLHVVLTGSPGPAHEAVLAEVAALDLESRVIVLGHVSPADLACLYRDAFALVYPSLFEGFGLPILESFHAGCPVVCAATTSCPEIAGIAAAYVDPAHPSTIVAALDRLDASPGERERLVEAGRLQAEKFSWQEAGRRTYETIRAGVDEARQPLTVTEPWPSITVITPSFNHARFITETIDSVLGQDYPRLDYIVMDGGSTDGTQEILRGYGDRVRWISEPDGGQADAINKGAARGHGEIVSWLNSDDTLEHGALHAVARQFLSSPDAAVVYGDADHVLEDGTYYGPYPTLPFDYERLAETCFICQPAAFMRRTALAAVGGVDAGLRFCMDYDLWIRLGRQHRFAYLPQVLARSRLHESAKTLASRDEVIREIIATVKRHYGVVPFDWAYKYADHRFNRSERDVFVPRRSSLLAYGVSIVLALWLNRGRPAYWPPTLRRAAKRVPSLLELFRVHEFHDRWSDGWISRRYAVSFPASPDATTVEIRGRHFMPGRRPLVLSVMVNGASVGTHSLFARGPFTIHVPCAKTDDGRVHLELVAHRTFRPIARGSRDTRRLSCIIDDVRAV